MRIHLDHNATTPLRPEARAAWLAATDALAGNPSSLHRGGRQARALIDDARERVASALRVREDDLVFTSGGTEANNFALRGALPAGGTLVTSQVEHSSVLETARALEKEGRHVHYVGVDSAGRPRRDDLEDALKTGSAMLSLMSVNNETGATTDLASIAAYVTSLGLESPPIFHTDAIQALGKIKVELSDWGVDLASFSAHKIGGPPGVGLLWKRAGTPLRPLLHGGDQENSLRPGTEDVAGIQAAAVAIELAIKEQELFANRTAELVHELWETLATTVEGIELVGPPLDSPRAPHTLCVRLPNTDGKVLVTRLDLEGIEVSAGSACASGSIEPSHVLRAMGYDDSSARAGLRISLGRETSRAECTLVADVLRNLALSSHAR